MSPRFASLLLWVVPLFSSVLQAETPATAPLPQVLVLANRDDPDSLALAAHYVKGRGLAPESVVALPMPLTEQITWPEFTAAIWNPLLREALARGMIDGIAMSTRDEIGRTKLAPSGHRLDALVICRGVPLRVAHDPALLDPKTNPLAANQAFRTTEAAVDSELALLAVGGHPVAAFVPNPVHHAADPSSLAAALRQIIPVGRLDGPTLAHAKAVADSALSGERDGLAGRAYLDLGGPHKQGDLWLEQCLPELSALGFETEVERTRATLDVDARSDAAVFYFGWYASHVNGPFAAPNYAFRPGAIALHIHSFSASTLRSPTQGWVGPLAARGVAATFGNVGEPYLEYTHQPQLLLRALVRGEPLGVAALRSVNALSWKAMVLGDPLYRPFAITAETQWANRSSLSPETAVHARIRRMRLLAAAGRGEEALALGRDGMRAAASLPLALSYAAMQHSAGDEAGARRTLAVFAGLKRWRVEDRPLVLAAAAASRALGASEEAVGLVDRLLEAKDLARPLRLAALKQGADHARAALDFARAARWDADHAALTAPPPAPPAKK